MAKATTLESLIDSYVAAQCPAAEQDANAKAIAKEVLNGSFTIQNLVLALGAYLTTTDTIVRARGTLLLSDIITELSATPIEDTAIKSLTNFYNARLGDWHCLRGAVLGSLSLLRRTSKVGKVEVEEAREMAQSALMNLHVQALAQKDRMLCLELFECLLEKHADAIAPLEGDLVFGITAAIEEEKDPRCLLLAFRIVQRLANLYPHAGGAVALCADELFDVVSRYFPISFNPQPGTPDGITREDLATALKETFACTLLFAPFCIPLLLEKLSSSVRRAKLDALSYLGHCALSFGATPMRQYTIPVWEALKAELLPSPVLSSSTSSLSKDVEILEEATNCLASWVLAFQSEKNSSMVVNMSRIMEAGDFLRLILNDELVEDLITCLKNDIGSPAHAEPVMKERAKHQAEAAGRVLAISAQASPSSCFIVTRQVLTRLMVASGLVLEEERHSSKEVNQPGQIRDDIFPPTSVIGLKVVLQVVQASRSLAEKCYQEQVQSAAMSSRQWLKPLQEQSPNLIVAFNEAIAVDWSSDSPMLGVAGLQALASFPPCLSPLSGDQSRSVLLVLKDLLLIGNEQEEVWAKVLTAVEQVNNVEERSGATGERNVGILTVIVPDLLGAVREAKTSCSVRRPLTVLAKICGPRSIARRLVIGHLTDGIHLDLLLAAENEELDGTCAKLVCVLQCLSEDILPWCDDQETDQSAIARLATEMWTILSIRAIRSNEEVLKLSLEAMRGAVVKCDTAAQNEILQKGAEVLFDTKSHHLQQLKFSSEEQVQIRQTNSNKRKSYDEDTDWPIALLASVIVSLRPTTTVPSKKALLDTMMHAARSEKPFFITEIAAQAVASMLNKWMAPSTDEAGDFTLEKAVDMVLDKGRLSEITGNSTLGSLVGTETGKSVHCRSVRQRVSGVREAAWVAKGLAMRGHSRISDVASILLRLLLSGTSEEGDEFILAMAAAEGLGIILKDTDVCLDKTHHAVIRPLYKQRFFSSMLTPLLEAVGSSDSAAKLWLYRGIGHLISGTPHVALLAHGEKVFPVILRALSYLCTDPRDSNILLSTLLALSAFLVDVNHGRSIAGEHVSSIGKHLLTLIQYQYSAVVRETALQCLGAVVGLPYTRVYPLRTEVLKAMPAALDDKKRVVRKEAVRCRMAWAAIASK